MPLHARMAAERMALESLEFYYDNRCALICLTWDQIQAAGVAGAELEDLTQPAPLHRGAWRSA